MLTRYPAIKQNVWLPIVLPKNDEFSPKDLSNFCIVRLLLSELFPVYPQLLPLRSKNDLTVFLG
jgi:hypothetical protein